MGLNIIESIPLCALFAGIGGTLEVLATAILAYPAAKITELESEQAEVDDEQTRRQEEGHVNEDHTDSDNNHHPDNNNRNINNATTKWTDRHLKLCLAINILLQVIASLSGNLVAAWYGPVSIVAPIFFASQLVANLVVFWIVLGLELFTKELQIGTYVVVVAVILLIVNGPTTQDYNEATFEQLVIQNVSASIWSIILLLIMTITGIILLFTAKLATTFHVSRRNNFHSRPLWYRITILLLARATAFSINLSTGKAVIMNISLGWLIINIILKVASGIIYTMAIVVQSTTVPQKIFVPTNAATTIFVNAITGMFIWQDYKAVQSWIGYVCVFALFCLGLVLLLQDLNLLQETSPETFRGARLAMTLRSNRLQLLDNIRTVGTRRRHHDIDGGHDDDDDDDEREALTYSTRTNITKKRRIDNNTTINQQRRAHAWAAIYENGNAAPKHSLSMRVHNNSYRRKNQQQLNDVEQRQMSQSLTRIDNYNKNIINNNNNDNKNRHRRHHNLPTIQSSSSIMEKTNSQSQGNSDLTNNTERPSMISVQQQKQQQQIVVVPPIDFHFEKGVCALSWWEPIKLLEEGSISDIHLVKRRPQFMNVKYKEKRNIMDLAKRKEFSTMMYNKNNKISTDDYNEQDVRVLKSIHKNHIGDDTVLEEMRSEIIVMSHLRHPNIVQLIEAYERKRHIYLVLEFCSGGTLANKKFTEPKAGMIVKKILSALVYLHSKGVAHRDIKLENIMLNHQGEIKLIDFGLATRFLSAEYSNFTDTVGTLYSMAPQVLMKRSDSSGFDPLPTDIWSLGVVTYLLLSGQQPFWGPHRPMSWNRRRRIMIDLIVKGEYAPMTTAQWKNISQKARDFITSILQVNSKARPTAMEAYQLPWIQSTSSDNEILKQSDADDDKDVNRRTKWLSEFRRKALLLLASKLSETDVETLREGLETKDTSGQGFVDIDVFLHLLDEIASATATSKLCQSDILILKEGMAHLDGNQSKMQLPYIDFIIDVHAGRNRNILDNLAKVLDNLDTNDIKKVPIDILIPALQQHVPLGCQKDLYGKLEEWKDEDGAVSTSQVLDWIGMEMVSSRRDSIRSESDKNLVL